MSAVAVMVVALLVACDSGPDAEAYRQRALDFQGAGKLNAAVVELKNALTLEPKDGDTRARLGQIYLTLGYGHQAHKELERARSLGTDNASIAEGLVRALLLTGDREQAKKLLDEVDLDLSVAAGLRGFAALGEGAIESAAEHFEEALRNDSGSLYALRGQSRIAMAQREWGEARRLLELAADKHPQAMLVWIDMANLELEQGQYVEAEAAIAKVLQQSSDVQAARYAMTRALLGQKKTVEARGHLKWLRSQLRKNTVLSYLSAVASMQEGDHQSARNHLLEALKLNDDHIPSLVLLGLIYFETAEYRQAEATLARLRAIAPGHLPAIMLSAAVNLKLGNPQGAIELLTVAARFRPEDANVAAMLGRAYLAANKPSDAVEFLNRAVSLAPESSAAHQHLAVGLLNAGDAAAAAVQAQTVVDAGVQDSGADVLLILSQLQSGDLKAAEDAARAYAQREPMNPLSHSLMGIVHELQGDATAARVAYERALDIQPDSVTAVLNLARLDLRAGGIDAARKRYEDLLARRANQPDALIALAGLAEGQASIALLQQARKGNPTALEPRLRLANLYLRGRNLHEGLEVAEEAVALAAENREALLVLARLQITAGLLEKAKGTVDTLVQAYPAFVQGLLEQARMQVGLRDLSGARNTLQRATRLEPDNRNVLLVRGGVELAVGDVAAARATAMSLMKTAPDAVEGGVLLARAHIRDGAFSEALSVTQKMLAKHPQATSVYMAMAAAQEGLGDVEAAMASIRRSLDRRGDDLKARLELARLSVVANRLDEGRKLFESVLEKAPDNERALAGLAELELQHGDGARAVRLAEKARRNNPRVVRPRVLLATEYLLQARFVEAKLIAEELRALAPQEPDVLLLWSKVQLLSGNIDEARTFGLRAMQLKPGDYETHYQMALVHNFAGEQRQAAVALRETRRLAPDFMPALISLVESASRLQRMDEALEVARDVQRRFPDFATGYGLEGDVLLRQGRADEARKAYLKAGQKGASPGTTAHRVARALRASGKASEAMRVLKEHLSVEPHDVEVRAALAAELLLSGEKRAAVEEYERLIERAPRHFLALNNLASLNHELGDIDKGLVYAQRAMEIRPDLPQLLDTYGWLLTESGQAEKAVQVLSQAATALPENGTVRFHLAMAYLKAGDLSAARNELTTLKSSALKFPERTSIDVYLQAMQ